MTTLMASLIVFLAVSLAAGAILTTVLAYRIQMRWMRIFCEKQGIPQIIMEPNRQPEAAKPAERPRAKISVPIPGMQMFRHTNKPQ